MATAPAISHRAILRFWAPLAATWLLMALEGASLSAIVARLPDPKFNLAAYGVAFAFAIIVESPVILLMSASTAFVRDGASYRALWKFTRRLNLIVSLVMVLLVVPPVWRLVADALHLEPDVAKLVHGALLWLLPWPAAIGDRRFHQGLLIRGHRTGQVAQGTVLRVVAMLSTALGLAWLTSLPGASVAGAALSAGVLVEALAVRRMVAPLVAPWKAEDDAVSALDPETLRQGAIFRFYLPMALTSFLALASQPIITFFMGRAAFAVESLAVLPVIHGLTFLFRALALSYQEVGIALLGDRGEQREPVVRFALVLALGVGAAMVLIAFTPLRTVWLRTVAGLSLELAEFAVLPLQIYALLPALSVLQSLQRALLVHGRRTGPLGWATGAEMGSIAAVLAILVLGGGAVGAVAAALATMAGRLVGLTVLWGPTRRALRRWSRSEVQSGTVGAYTDASLRKSEEMP